MSTCVFIESNTTGTGHLLVELALDQGHQVSFLTATPSKYAYLETMTRKDQVNVEQVDTTDLDAITNVLNNIDDIIAVMSSSELYVAAAAAMAEKFTLFGPASAAIRLCRDKFALQDALSSAGVGYPVTKMLPDCLADRQSTPLPVVVKPRDGTGSCDVRKIESWSQLDDWMATWSHQQPDNFMVQQYIGGQEYSAEIIADDNGFHLLSIVKKHLTAPPIFLELGHDCPYQFDDAQQQTVEAKLIAALKSTGLVKGPSHIEFKIDEQNQLYIIEINPRLAGGMIPVALNHVYDFDLLSYLLKLYQGQSVQWPQQANRYVSIRFAQAQTAGKLEWVEGFEATEQAQGVLRSGMMSVIGRDIELNGDFRDRIAFVIAAGETIADSAANAEHAISHISHNLQ